MRVHGHRGARAVLPENTMPAFEYAIALGVGAIELDVVVTSDDVVVVSHDATMNPKFCRGPAGSQVIRELTLEELHRWDCGAVTNPDYPRQRAIPGTRVPTLAEVLRRARPSNVELHIEMKMFPLQPEFTPPLDRFAELVLSEIYGVGMAQRVAVLSFDFEALHAVRRLDAAMSLCALYEPGDADFVELAEAAGASIVSPHHSIVTTEKTAAVHAAGLRVVAWTANEPHDWNRLIAAGVDAIVTDDPAALIAHLKSRSLR